MRLSFVLTCMLMTGVCLGVEPSADIPLHGQAVHLPAYLDERPQAEFRLDIHDQGVVLAFGTGPDRCDYRGAREAQITQYKGHFYLFYDGAGPQGWLACLATGTDLTHWTLHGPALQFGKQGEIDSGSASSPWIVEDGDRWHMYYVACRGTTPPPDCIPAMPYYTRAAQSTAPTPAGPWVKQPGVIPFDCVPGTYYEVTASPGAVIKDHERWLMFFSAARQPRAGESQCPKRTLSIATTRDLDGAWTPNPEPILPSSEQIENSSLYQDPTSGIWYLFTNHIGMPADGPAKGSEFTDSVWVYWSKDLTHWDPKHKAVVIDGTTCTWSHACIGMPSVTAVGNRLAVFYDGPGGQSTSHMERKIGLAWVDLPLNRHTGPAP